MVHLDTHWFARDWFCDLEFDPVRFPDPAGFASAPHDRDVRLSLWQLPYLPEGSAVFDDVAAVDGFVKTTESDLYDVAISYVEGWEGRVGCLDLTNPEARQVLVDADGCHARAPGFAPARGAEG